MKHLFIKALVFGLVLIIGYCLYWITFIVFTASMSKPDGLAELAMPYIWAASVVLTLISFSFTYFVLKFFSEKIPHIHRSVFSIVIFWFFMVLFSNIFPKEYHRCDLYTDVMNGGIKTFQGKDYRIELCGLNGIIQPDNFQNDEVRLRVFSMEGELLAERYYAPLLGMRFGIQVDYGDDYLTYDTATTGPTQKIAIPPSRWERMRAQLPRMWP
jgi:hypothetical protein